jgi:hypothetical protein
LVAEIFILDILAIVNIFGAKIKDTKTHSCAIAQKLTIAKFLNL